MYLPDLGPRRYHSTPRLRAPWRVAPVGWLARAHPYPTGDTTTAFADKLRRLLARCRAQKAPGFHHCDLCEGLPALMAGYVAGVPTYGAAQVWVPSATEPVVYAAPDLVHHYVTRHAYAPPAVFVAAVEAFDEASAWRPSDLMRPIRARGTSGRHRR